MGLVKQSQWIPPAKKQHSTSKFKSFTKAKMVQDKNYQAKGLVSSHLRHTPMVGMKMPTSCGDGGQRWPPDSDKDTENQVFLDGSILYLTSQVCHFTEVSPPDNALLCWWSWMQPSSVRRCRAPKRWPLIRWGRLFLGVEFPWSNNIHQYPTFIYVL